VCISILKALLTKHHQDNIQDTEAVLNPASVNRVHDDNDDENYIDDDEE
jgi:hypothetical protein